MAKRKADQHRASFTFPAPHHPRGRAKTLLFRDVSRRRYIQPAQQLARRCIDVRAALLPLHAGPPKPIRKFCGSSADRRHAAQPIRPHEIHLLSSFAGTAMLQAKRFFKNYEETGSLNESVNLYGFIGPEVFLTKTGEVGLILEVRGVDYECLDGTAIDGLTKRLESALNYLATTIASTSICSSETMKPFPTNSTATRSWTRQFRTASLTLAARPTLLSPFPSTT